VDEWLPSVELFMYSYFVFLVGESTFLTREKFILCQTQLLILSLSLLYSILVPYPHRHLRICIRLKSNQIKSKVFNFTCILSLL
jgi:hypothetical protein